MLNAGNFVLRQILNGDTTCQFSLGKKEYTPLKTFLQKNAYDFHEFDIAKTYVLVNNPSLPSRVFGYITLMNSEILLNEGQRPQEPSAVIKYEAFPAVKIARLAIDKSLQGKGYGKQFLSWCINHVIYAIVPNVGCRFLVVDAKQDSVEFYKKSGFLLLTTDTNQDNEHPLMFFDLFKFKNRSP